MKNVTTEMLMSCPLDTDGWRVLPDGNNVSVGYNVRLCDNVSLGVGVRCPSHFFIEALK